jgi:hypothetical protein
VALGKTIETRLRERELAGDVRAGSWVRGQVRTDQRAFLREHWRLFTGLAALTLAFALIVCALTPSMFLKGLILGVVLAAVPGVIWSWTMQVTGSAPRMMGDEAEQWTARELRKMRRQGWRLVNQFQLALGDIDHVLIGPGGAYAVGRPSGAPTGTVGTRSSKNARLSAKRCRTHGP